MGNCWFSVDPTVRTDVLARLGLVSEHLQQSVKFVQMTNLNGKDDRRGRSVYVWDRFLSLPVTTSSMEFKPAALAFLADIKSDLDQLTIQCQTSNRFLRSFNPRAVPIGGIVLDVDAFYAKHRWMKTGDVGRAGCRLVIQKDGDVVVVQNGTSVYTVSGFCFMTAPCSHATSRGNADVATINEVLEEYGFTGKWHR